MASRKKTFADSFVLALVFQNLCVCMLQEHLRGERARKKTPKWAEKNPLSFVVRCQMHVLHAHTVHAARGGEQENAKEANELYRAAIWLTKLRRCSAIWIMSTHSLTLCFLFMQFIAHFSLHCIEFSSHVIIPSFIHFVIIPSSAERYFYSSYCFIYTQHFCCFLGCAFSPTSICFSPS